MALRKKKMAILGSGNMGEALVKGLLRAGKIPPESLVCTDERAERREEVQKRYGVMVSSDNRAAASHADIIVLAVKPQVMDLLLEQIASAVDARKLVISIAAGVPISAISHKLGAGVRIVRAMPNTPALVGAGAAALARGPHATDEDLEQALSLFEAVGAAVVVEEHHLDAVTGLSGSGPAFVFMAIEALADGGVKVGLARPIAMALAAQAVMGAAKLVLETGEHPGRLKDQVTSPGGTSIAGVHALEQHGFRAALIAAVEVATKRSKELGELASR
jgi:pyrroline-5-carboxylate reductase